MTTKERILELVEQMTDEDAAEALDYMEWLLSDEEVVTAEEMAAAEHGFAQIERGEYATLEEVKRSLVPTTSG